jgi:tetratricopeptide (TPR) repeat protein
LTGGAYKCFIARTFLRTIRAYQVSRTARRKLYYFSFFAIGTSLLVGAILHFHLSGLKIALLVIALIIPGRILGFFWGDQLAGLRLLKEGRFEESARHSKRFLDLLARRRWIRHLIWLGMGTYSRDPQSLALNNLGAAEMFLGNFADAKQHLEESRKLDDENPLPYFNLAQLHMILEEPSKAQEFLALAKRRGYPRGLSDKLIHGAQSRFSYTDSARKSPINNSTDSYD